MFTEFLKHVPSRLINLGDKYSGIRPFKDLCTIKAFAGFIIKHMMVFEELLAFSVVHVEFTRLCPVKDGRYSLKTCSLTAFAIMPFMFARKL